jgi:hypothetical protein
MGLISRLMLFRCERNTHCTMTDRFKRTRPHYFRLLRLYLLSRASSYFGPSAVLKLIFARDLLASDVRSGALASDVALVATPDARSSLARTAAPISLRRPHGPTHVRDHPSPLRFTHPHARSSSNRRAVTHGGALATAACAF